MTPFEFLAMGRVPEGPAYEPDYWYFDALGNSYATYEEHVAHRTDDNWKTQVLCTSTHRDWRLFV